MPGVTGSSPVSSTITAPTEERPIVRPWKLRHRVLSFSDPPWIDVYTDTVELPDGRVRESFHRVVVPEFSITVAVTPDRRFVMVREYKHGALGVCLNAPAGMLEAGEDPLAAAKRELREESGYASDDWRALGSWIADGSTGCGRGHAFLARDARPIGAPRPDDTEDIEVVLLDEAGLRRALASGEVVMMSTACAIGLAFLELRSG